MKWLCLVVLLVMAERPASACGAGVVSSGTVAADAQRIFLSVRGGKTEIVLQVVVPRSPGDYGALIPLPGQPTLDAQPVSSAELDALDRATQVMIVEPSDGGGCGCGSKDAGATPRGGGALVEEVNIGPVVASTLRGDDAAAVNQWLSDNGFVVAADQRVLIDQYSAPGRFFVAVRRNGAVAEAPDSIGVHLTLDGDQRALPLRFTRMGAGPELAFTIFVVTAVAAGPAAPWTALRVDQLAADVVHDVSYPDAVAFAVSTHGNQAFVAEYRGPVTGLLGTRLSTLVDPGHTLTRYSTLLSTASISSDVSFDGPAPAEVPRVIAGLPLALLVAAFVWRRRRATRS